MNDATQVKPVSHLKANAAEVIREITKCREPIRLQCIVSAHLEGDDAGEVACMHDRSATILLL